MTDSDPGRSHAPGAVWERHLFSILATIIGAGIIGLGSLIYSLNSSNVQLISDVRYLRQQLDDMKNRMDRQYSITDAVRDFQVRDQRIEDIRSVMRDVELRVRDLERTAAGQKREP